jgi:hypothetical protein
MMASENPSSSSMKTAPAWSGGFASRRERKNAIPLTAAVAGRIPPKWLFQTIAPPITGLTTYPAPLTAL